MAIVSLYQLADLTGLLNGRLGKLQESQVYRHKLHPVSADYTVYESPKFGNWNLAKGVTVRVDKKPLVEDNKFKMVPSVDTLTGFDLTGNKIQVRIPINAAGRIEFAKPLKPENVVEVDFSFRFKLAASLGDALYQGMLDIGRQLYQTLDPVSIMPQHSGLIVTAALRFIYEEMSSEASLYYDYTIEEQSHSKSEVAANLLALMKLLDDNIAKGVKQAIWMSGNGRARQIVSVQQHYTSSADIRGGAGFSSSHRVE